MPPTAAFDPASGERVEYHRDGSVRARGPLRDGTRMRSGHFAVGTRVGEWTTYDRNGDVYRVTRSDESRPRPSSAP